jgi:predicted peptidase
MKIAFRVVSAMLIFAVAAMGCMSTSRPKPTALGVGCPPAKVDLKWAATVTRAEVSQEGLNYRIYVPENIGFFEKVPLVVFLHGAGERGNDNTVQMIHAVPQLISYSMRKNEKAIIVAPQCPEKLRWFETPWDKTEHHTTSEPSVSMDKVIKLLDRMLAEYPIDADRVYVTGLSMGGYGTWDLSARRPELFAAALPVCGGGDVTQAHKLAKLPLMTVHGDKDGAVPVQNSRQMVKAVRDAGGNITYIELAGQGHGVWGYTYGSDKNLEWLFAQRRGVTP